MPALLCCLEAWADCPEVTTAALKFMGEFVLNKTQRLTFDAASCSSGRCPRCRPRQDTLP